MTWISVAFQLSTDNAVVCFFIKFTAYQDQIETIYIYIYIYSYPGESFHSKRYQLRTNYTLEKQLLQWFNYDEYFKRLLASNHTISTIVELLLIKHHKWYPKYFFNLDDFICHLGPRKKGHFGYIACCGLTLYSLLKQLTLQSIRTTSSYICPPQNYFRKERLELRKL